MRLNYVDADKGTRTGKTVIVYLKDGTSHTYQDVWDVYIMAELPKLLQIRQATESWFYNMDEVKFYGVH